MSTRAKKLPKLCLHKATGQAFVKVGGKPLYLGKFGTPLAQRRYAYFLEQLAAAAEKAEAEAEQQPILLRQADDLTIVELLADYWVHVEATYRKHGQPQLFS